MLGLISRAGARILDRATSPDFTEPDLYYLAGEEYPSTVAARDFAAIRPVVDGQLEELAGPVLWDNDTPLARTLDEMSVHTWIETFVPGGHESRLGQLLDLGYTIECGVDSQHLSAINLLRQVATQPCDDEFHVLGGSDERYRVAGGTNEIIEGLWALLPDGSMRLGAAVRELHRDGRQAGLVVADGGHGTKTEVFDYVVLCLPFSALRRVDYSLAEFDELKTAAIEQLGYATHSKIQLEYRGRPWQSAGPHRGSGTSFTDLAMQATWESTAGDPSNTSILVAYAGGPEAVGRQLTEAYVTQEDPEAAALANEVVAAVDEVWPGSAKDYCGRATVTSPSSNRHLCGSYSARLTGQYTAFHGYESCRQGPFFFAGEHCSIEHQRFMEGAARAGIAAARGILELTQP